MTVTDSPLADVPGLFRIETTGKDLALPTIMDMTRAVYPHEQVHGTYCTVQEHLDCPPREVFDYLSHTVSLAEWTYSMRGFRPTGEPGLWVSEDRLGDDTDIYTRTVANTDAMTVDYHCAWDQGEDLWMIYLMRVVPAELVLGKPGSVVLWTNCHHRFYDDNPYPETAPEGRGPWVGDFWDLFPAGHLMELRNLKAICEHRHRAGIPVTPESWGVAG